MRALHSMLSVVGLVVLLLGASALQTLAAPPSPPTAVTLRDGLRGFRLVDPQTGEEVWRTDGDRENVANVIVGPDGRAYVSVVDADGASTVVYDITPGASDAMPIGSVLGRVAVAAVDPAGDTIHLLEFPPPTPDDGFPPTTGVSSLPLPAGKMTRAPAAVPGRDDEGFGILSSDGERWYGFLPSSDEWDAPTELVALTFRDDETPNRESLLIPGLSSYRTLLLAPDGRTLYVIDYYAQAIQVIGGSPLAVQDVVGFGRYVTKRTTCAAALAPQGDRLYVLANSGSTDAGDGILVFETDSWRLVGHYLPGRRFYCLAVSPDGGGLYASSIASSPSAEDPWLVTIDAVTGKQLGSVALKLGDYFTPVGPVLGNDLTVEIATDPPAGT